ncbi:MAG: hypothetical protein WB817_13230 [Terriglobales bacterium]
MSVVVMLMIGGWTVTLSMIGVCALRDSGKLPELRRRIALWLLENSPAPIVRAEENLESGPEGVA